MLNRLWEWTLNNPEQAGALAGFLATAVILIVRNGWARIRESLKELMLIGERKRRQNELPFDGPAIMEWVINQALTRLVPIAPFWLRPWLTQERLRRLAQAAFDKAHDWLDNGKIDGSNMQTPASQGAATSDRPADQAAGGRTTK